MSRILKAGIVNFDNKAKILIDVPNFPDKTEPIIKTEKYTGSFENEHDIIAKHEAKARTEANRIIHEAELKASEITKKAEENASLVLEQANQESVKILEQAKTQGYEHGYSEGTNATDGLIKQAQNELDEAVKERRQIIGSIESEMVEIISDAVNKLTKSLVKIDSNVIVNLIYQGFYQSTLFGTIRIQVSQADYDDVIARKDEILAKAEGSENVEIVKNLTLEKSDCLIETPFGNMDCSLDQQLTALKNNLLFILENKN